MALAVSAGAAPVTAPALHVTEIDPALPTGDWFVEFHNTGQTAIEAADYKSSCPARAAAP